MARFILIDSNSGHIWGDTADLNGPARDETPAEAAKRLDESLNEFGRSYEEHGRGHILNGADAYFVYRADIDGSEVVPIVRDGQDLDVVEAVMNRCQLLSIVTFKAPSE
jgi:hypothetical protein